MNKKIIKNTLSIVLLLSMIFTSLLQFNVFANNYDEEIISKRSIICYNDTIIQQKKLYNGDNISTVNKDNYTIEAIFNELTNYYSVNVYLLDDNVINELMSREGYLVTTPLVQPQTIYTESDNNFGYTYYYNTDSAYGDRYWRLDNPNRNPVRKTFFGYLGTSNNNYAIDFANSVESMKGYQQAAAVITSVKVVSSVLTAIGATIAFVYSQPVIAMDLVATTLSLFSDAVDAQLPLYNAYAQAANADMYFDSIV